MAKDSLSQLAIISYLCCLSFAPHFCPLSWDHDRIGTPLRGRLWISGLTFALVLLMLLHGMASQVWPGTCDSGCRVGAQLLRAHRPPAAQGGGAAQRNTYWERQQSGDLGRGSTDKLGWDDLWKSGKSSWTHRHVWSPLSAFPWDCFITPS